MVILEKEIVSAGQLKNLEFEENRPCQKIIENNIGDNFSIRLINAKFPIDERHRRALRQLLNQAEVLREVSNFIKEKKLTGEQTQELVQTIKSQPRLTFEESYQKLKGINHKKESNKDPIEILFI